jgi:hypothetical protein
MLDSAIRFKAAVKDITSEQDNNLRDYELSRDEWAVLEELRDVLKVSCVLHSHKCFAGNYDDTGPLDPQGRHAILLSRHTQPGHCHTCHGQD